MVTTRAKAAAWLALVVLSLVVVGCQWGIGARVAPTPIPPATPMLPATPLPPSANTPTAFEEKLKTIPRKTELTKVIDGYLHARYLPPCEIVPSPAEWVASIILTDLRSGSIAYLNRDGTVKFTDYRTEDGKAALEAVLAEDSVMKQIVERPECPDGYKK